MKYVVRLIASFFLSWGTLAHSQDFLDPEVAFKFAVTAPNAKTLEARWQIADGYYLYRQKFKFELTGGTLGTASYPSGKMKEDENFGKVEIYRKEVRVTLPFERAPGTTAVTLKATYQGCADAGLCYTPTTQTRLIPLPPAPKAVLALVAKPPVAIPAQSLDTLTKPVQSSSVLAGLRSLGGDPMPKILPPEEAFKAQGALTDAQTVTVNFGLTDATYLYRDKLGFVVKSPVDISVTKKTLPQADVKEDPNFGRTEVYHHDFAATLGLSRALKADETLVLEATYQGCNEKVGICYPPITTPFTLAAATAGVASAPGAPAMSQTEKSVAPAASTMPVAATPSKTGAPESDTSKIEKVLKGGSFWAVLATFFGFGLLLALTPCVFPMIPILSGIIAGQKKTPTKTHGFLLALAYVLGMAITYSLAGVAAALSGTLISNALQNPWALGVGAMVFVALALSMFGFFELQLPSAIQSKFSDASNKMKGGNFVGVFVMGALSAVIVGPCVAPPLAAALAFIAQTGNTVLGGAALFMLALGMGVPLLLIGLSAGALLPKAGGWMNAVKYFFGVMMLAIAIYLISPIIPAWVNMLLWAMLLVASAVYLSALETLPHNASGWKRLWKACGVVLLAGGLALVLGILGGSRDVLQPLAVYQVGTLKTVSGSNVAEAAEAHGIKFERVKSVADLDAKIAASPGREIMLDFYADWCVSCKEMERYTFNDPKVQARLKDVVLLQADVTVTNDDSKALLKRFGLFGPPGMIFWNAQGVQSDYKVVGYEAPEKFLVSLGAALGQ